VGCFCRIPLDDNFRNPKDALDTWPTPVLTVLARPTATRFVPGQSECVSVANDKQSHKHPNRRSEIFPSLPTTRLVRNEANTRPSGPEGRRTQKRDHNSDSIEKARMTQAPSKQRVPSPQSLLEIIDLAAVLNAARVAIPAHSLTGFLPEFVAVGFCVARQGPFTAQ
jgi:hypothetical protein